MKGIISLFVFNILSSKTHNFKDVLEGLAVLIVQRVLLIEGCMSRVPELPAYLLFVQWVKRADSSHDTYHPFLSRIIRFVCEKSQYTGRVTATT